MLQISPGFGSKITPGYTLPLTTNPSVTSGENIANPGLPAFILSLSATASDIASCAPLMSPSKYFSLASLSNRLILVTVSSTAISLSLLVMLASALSSLVTLCASIALLYSVTNLSSCFAFFASPATLACSADVDSIFNLSSIEPAPIFSNPKAELSVNLSSAVLDTKNPCSPSRTLCPANGCPSGYNFVCTTAPPGVSTHRISGPPDTTPPSRRNSGARRR